MQHLDQAGRGLPTKGRCSSDTKVHVVGPDACLGSACNCQNCVSSSLKIECPAPDLQKQIFQGCGAGISFPNKLFRRL